jgi:hypothetical protein
MLNYLRDEANPKTPKHFNKSIEKLELCFQVSRAFFPV